MKVVIAEDEPLARSLLRTLLEESGDVEVVGEAANGADTLALTERFTPDAVFLDVDMPGGGIAAAYALHERSAAEIVFVTAHEPQAVDAFDIGAIDYLLKPVRRSRLARTLDRIRTRLREKRPATPPQWSMEGQPAFWVDTRLGKTRVLLSDVIWIEAARDHVYFHTSERTYLHRITMCELEEKLRSTGMIRIQRSAFVRIDKVASILRRGKSMLLELEDKTQVPVGPSYQAKALSALPHLGLG